MIIFTTTAVNIAVPRVSCHVVLVNPSAAGTVYIRFQASFTQNKMPLKSTKYFCDRCSVNKIIQFCI